MRVRGYEDDVLRPGERGVFMESGRGTCRGPGNNRAKRAKVAH